MQATGHRFDPNTPIEETMQALHDVVKAGYVRYIGMSSCYAYQCEFILGIGNLARYSHLTPLNSPCHAEYVRYSLPPVFIILTNPFS